MFYRWLHNIWKYFWSVVLTLLLLFLLLAGGIFGLLQLDTSRSWLTGKIEAEFGEQYAADLSIGELDGVLPFAMQLQDVLVTSADSARRDTLASVARINADVDVWGLLQNRLTITGFEIEDPRVKLQRDRTGGILFLEKKRGPADAPAREGEGRLLIPQVEIIAPLVSITNGTVVFGPQNGRERSGSLQGRFTVENIDADLFLELTNEQRYLDIENFSARSEDLKLRQITLNGQVYNDSRYLEFNSFNIRTRNSNLTINGEIDGVDLYKRDLSKQLFAGRYDLEIRSPGFHLTEFDHLLPGLPAVSDPLTFAFSTHGTTDSLRVDNLSFGVGESYISISGLLKNLRERERFNYRLFIADTELRKRDVELLFGELDAGRYRALENLSFTGNANGSLDSLFVDLNLSSPHGELMMKGSSLLREPFQYSGSLSGKNLNIAPFLESEIDTTSLNFDSRLSGMGVTPEDAIAELSTSFYNSTVDRIRFESLDLNSILVDGLLKQEYLYRDGSEVVEGDGWIDFGEEKPRISHQGRARNIDLAAIFGPGTVAATRLNVDYNLEFSGLKADEVEGRANLDIKPSVFNGDSARAHQLYMDIDSPDQQSRTFRLTSSLFDMNVTGQIYPSLLARQAEYWGGYLRERFRSEILLRGEPADSVIYSRELPEELLVLDGSVQVKDIGLLRNYFPEFPAVTTDSRLTFNINTEGSRLLLSADMRADTLRYGEWHTKESRTQLTASFRSDRKLKEFSSVDLQTDIGHFRSANADMDSVVVNVTAKQDSLFMLQQVNSISGNASFRVAAGALYRDSVLSVTVDDFFLGNDEYAWQTRQNPSFTYNRDGRVSFRNFRFENRDESVELQGVMSADRQDSVQYTLREVNLSRISDLIRGKVDFAGIVNGTVVTRSLTDRPSIQGELAVNRLALDNRLVGDARFRSRYNSAADRFDTEISVLTDSTKYGGYLEENDGVGQNIKLEGWFVPPDLRAPQDSVYYFDADFEEIDMWVVSLIIDNIFSEIEGQASGEGYITGNLEDFDFHADFLTRHVYAKPRFVETNYFINGRVALDRREGVVLDSLRVLDTKGGTGIVHGTVDLNDFKPLTYLDLTLDLNELQFMNNEYNPDIPFYGNISGTGRVKLDGSNTDMYLRTEKPVRITSDSEVSIPLIEETALNKNTRFIRFVDSFETRQESSLELAERNRDDRRAKIDEERLETAIKNLTFSERVDLDLQFNAPSNVNVRLIFDPVTGEVLRAQGTGQLRMTMQDQDLQMFGSYNIASGNYQFVSGEIFSRRLELESGGSIVWEGDPDNARLDISAVYRARPNISTLISGTATEAVPQRGGQQVPVDLIVEIAGTVSSVENNYYFRLPNSVEISSGSPLSYRLNQVNRDEQEKLLQATSILVTGQFIPSQNSENPTASLSQSITRGSTVINPLISNQVISPLLSNQINSLLNSDVSRFDIDFNLNAYNEIDLGIALRLYNDRLILRREGQLTGGPESTLGDRIGDLNATYRIRKGLSLTAFHRQDQILGNMTTASQAGDVTPSVDGVGVEAQVQYNTWQELVNRITSTFRKLFGIKEDEKEEKEENRITGTISRQQVNKQK